MSATSADILIDTLVDWGVCVVFGLPGDGINGIMEALRKRQEKIKFIQVRHEESAALMACGYAKFTGNLGVCLATSGPGGIHLLNGLYDAKLDSQPVLAITGLQFHDLIHTRTQQDVDMDRLYMDVCVYNARVMGPLHVENVTELACRTAMARKGVAHITIPSDIQSLEAGKRKPSMRNVPGHTSRVYSKGIRLPQVGDLQRAAEILNKGKKIAILAGFGAVGATDELEQLAEKLGAPVVKALLGKQVVPDDSPYTTGQVGMLGTKASQDVLESCDTLFIVGSSFPYIEYYPKPGQARGIQLDIDAARIGLRYPVELGLVGDASESLRQLLPLLKRNEARGFLEKAQKATQGWWDLMEMQGTRGDAPMKPQVVAWELGKRLSDSAIVSCDSGSITFWWARQVPAKRGQMFNVSGTLATMGCGLPYAIAAQIAYPERQTVAFVGDGGFSMLMADFVTCIKYKLPVKVIIIKNNLLAQIQWEQIILEGNPEFGCALEPIDFAAFARACGGSGFTVDDPSECGRIIEEALHTPGPVIVDAIVDPHEPPLPPRIPLSKAKNIARSLAKGTPYRGKIAATITADKVREMI